MWRCNSSDHFFLRDGKKAQVSPIPAHVSGRHPVINLVDNLFCIIFVLRGHLNIIWVPASQWQYHRSHRSVGPVKPPWQVAALIHHEVSRLALTQHSQACWLADEAVLLSPLYFPIRGWHLMLIRNLEAVSRCLRRDKGRWTGQSHRDTENFKYYVTCKQQLLTVPHAVPG